jgi:hypothetical protein
MLFGHFLIFYCIGSRNTIRVSINLWKASKIRNTNKKIVLCE